MGNVIKHISSDDKNPVVLFNGFADRPNTKTSELQEIESLDNSYSAKGCLSMNPYRSKFIVVADPNMQILRAKNKSPHERKVVHESLLSTLIYRLEKKDEDLS